MTVAAPALPRAIVLVGNLYSGRSRRGMAVAEKCLARHDIAIHEVLHMNELERLRAWVVKPEDERPIIVAAGGDGTVGAVTNYVASTGAVLGILPLGTSNDVARSLGIPMRIDDAVALLAAGKVSTVDLGRYSGHGEAPRYFVHAAAMGIDVQFARLATQTALRKRLGRFTYAVAAILALRDRQPFSCELHLEGRVLPLCLLHLSVINAPIFGGRWGFSIAGSNVDDRRLDVLAVENVPLRYLLPGIFPLLLHKRPRVRGIRLYHVSRLRIHIEQVLDVSLDGEIAARIPGEFTLAPEALRVVTPLDFEDVDD